jgi:tRNA modification GTPase
MPTPSPTAELSATHVVELTPIGRSAVSVVLVDGPNSVRAVGQYFVASSGQPLANTSLNRIVVGRWGGPGGEELVVCRRGEERVEVHCHGGVAAVRAVVDALAAAGCREIPWCDWLRRSAADSLEAAARIALADAVTARTAAILLDQLNGALANALRETTAAVSASDWSRATQLVGQLLRHRELGVHLTTPWRVVLAGPPNVGKSSLMNALAGYQRAIVSPLPGTTRDVVTLSTAIDGWPVELADTAGLRATNDELETAGVQLAEATLTSADLVILVQDTTQVSASRLYSDWHGGQCPPYDVSRVIHVLNKIDLAPVAPGATAVFGAAGVEDDPARNMCFTSAPTGEGIAALVTAIGRSLVPDPPTAGAAVPFTPAQAESLVVARNAIERRHIAAAREALQSLLSI